MLPEVNVSLLRTQKQHDEELKHIGGAIYEAFKKDGFVILRGTGLRNNHLHIEVVNEVKNFMELGLDIKKQIAFDTSKSFFYGYTGQTLKDLEDRKTGDLALVESINFNPNDGVVYPKEAPNLRRALEALWEAERQIALKIMECLALHIGKGKTFFEQFYSGGVQGGKNDFTLRTARHPPLSFKEIPDKVTRFGEHVDYAVMAMVIQEEVGGLELMKPSGEWVEPPVDEDTVILIPGEVLELWMKGDIKATRHHVPLPKDDRRFLSRHSQIFFLVPDRDASIRAFDGSVDDRFKQFETYEDYCAYKNQVARKSTYL